MEIIRPVTGRRNVRAALFDFDGTLSLIREGWQKVMAALMVEHLLEAPRRESEPELRAIVSAAIDRLTGEQTIYQMIWLSEAIAQRGGQPVDPFEHKREYHERLWEKIEGRVTGLKSGRIPPSELLVPGAREFLAALQARSVICYLASGTDEPYVRDEATALGLAGYFAGIHGARDDYLQATKQAVIERILSEHNLRGAELVGFGDGYVEIESVRRVGGLAVGLATDERGRRDIDAWKRQRLIGAGADLILPDFREHEQLVSYLFGDDERRVTNALPPI